MLKAEFVFTCIFVVSTLTTYCSNTNQARWVKFIHSHVQFISKSNSENDIKIY